MTSTPLSAGSQLSLAGHLRAALEAWQGDTLSGPWDDIIDELSKAVSSAEVSVRTAARLDFLLRRTANTEPDACETCGCSAPGLTHQGVTGLGTYAGGAVETVTCPDPRLHRFSFDGKCRYCRGVEVCPENAR